MQYYIFHGKTHEDLQLYTVEEDNECQVQTKWFLKIRLLYVYFEKFNPHEPYEPAMGLCSFDYRFIGLFI